VKFKLNESLGTSAVRAFEDAGHDTSSIHRQSLAGAQDGHVFRICRDEQRILVTLDLDFANRSPSIHAPPPASRRSTAHEAPLRPS
jgi:predicted nuclease of predicted toxin-antitoxin system